MKTQLLTLLIFGTIFCQTTSAQNYSVYVSDATGDQILKYDQNGQNETVFIPPNSGGMDWPQDIFFIEEDTIVLVSGLNNGKIFSYHANTGQYIGVWASGIGGPTRMTLGPDSLLYVLQWGGNGRVWRYELDGTFVDEFTDTGVNQSIGIAWDDSLNLYISSYQGSVRKFDTAGVSQGLFINSNLAGPTNIWFNDTGAMFVLDYNASSVKYFDATGNYNGVFIPGVGQPEGVAILPNGNWLIGDKPASTVKEFDNQGNYIGEFTNDSLLQVPNAVILRADPSLGLIENTRPEIDIYPTMGDVFYCSGKDSHNIERVEVYNSSGTLVYQENISGSLLWNAPVSEGIYSMAIIMSSGEIDYRKLMVCH